VFSSRTLERATYDLVAFRFIAANEHPNHNTIAAFRRRFLKQIKGLFVQVLLLVREMGTVALDARKSTPTQPAQRAFLLEKRRNRPQRLQQREARSRDETGLNATGQRVVLPRRLEHHACVPIM
jgi:hypothetical protein